MKLTRPQSYQIGRYIVRRDAGASRVWRVFFGGIEVFASSSLRDAYQYAIQNGIQL